MASWSGIRDEKGDNNVIQLTKRGDYGILAVCQIAQSRNGQFMSIDEVSVQSHIPKPYLSKILQDLSRGGILYSRRGMGGGFKLARHPSEISLRDIIEIVEGKMAIVACAGAPDHCEKTPGCVLAPLWDKVQCVIDELIASITVEDLVSSEKRHHQLEQLTIYQKLWQGHHPIEKAN
jgi:Rrf2 family protein